MSKQQTRHLSDDIFKEYDIRGKVGSELLLEEVYRLGRAIAYYLKEKKPYLVRIAVGADGRTHSPAMKEELCRALYDSGIDVIFIGICPTPVLYFAQYMLPVDGGLMITASHNSKEYNGIKIMLDKKPVWKDEIQLIKNYYFSGKHFKQSNGTYTEHMLIDTYIAWFEKNFTHLKGNDIAVVVDCGNGAAGTVLPKLCEVMHWHNAKLLYPEVDGTYPHHTADPAVEENMRDVQHILQTTEYQVGVGLDGDCDRMSAVTKSGHVVLGDKLLALFAQDIRRDISSPIVIYDLKCSLGLRELLQKWNITSYASPTGHAWVKEYMQKYNAILGGELSCHFFFHDRYFGFDDGIYAMIRLFEILTKSGKTLDELVAIFPHKISSPEIRFEYPKGKQDSIIAYVRKHFKHKNAKIMTIDGVHVTFEHGWGIIRASNTQPVLSIRFEADTQKDFKSIKDEFITSLEPFYERAFLDRLFCGN